MAKGLAPTRTVLDNGTVVLAKAARATPAVTITLALRAGSASDPTTAEGTAWLLSRAIDRGTVTRTAAQIADELDCRGITLTSTVTRHVFSLTVTCLAEDFEPVLALLAEIVTAPSLPEDEIATRKREVITTIRQDEDNPAIQALTTLMMRLYPDGHPYGRRTKGSIEIVERLTRADLARFHAERFTPSALCAVIVGDVDPAQATAGAARVLGSWRHAGAPATVVPPARPAPRRDRVVLPMMNKAQADIAYGFVAIRRNDPDYYAAWLMNNVFGQYALGGRLGDSIRERQGMAYYVSSSLDANIAEGPLSIRAGISPANVERAIASIDTEIARLIDEGVTAKELEESRRYLIGSMPRALETNGGIANFLLNEETFGLGLDYDLQLPGYLTAVTLDAVNAIARRVLDPDRATVVVAGPYQG